MQALRVRLVGLGASLVLVLTGIGGVGSALATHDDNVAVACPVVGVADRGGANAQSFNLAQGNATTATGRTGGTGTGGGGTATGGTNAACIAVAADDHGTKHPKKH